MKIRIEIKIGDKIIANDIREPDDILALYEDPRAAVEMANRMVWQAMGKAIDRALEELLAKGIVQEPPRRDGNPYDLRFDVT